MSDATRSAGAVARSWLGMATATSRHRVVVVARDVVLGDADLSRLRPDRRTIAIIFDRRVAERRQRAQDHIPERRRAADRRGQSSNGAERLRRSARWVKARAIDLAACIAGVLLVLGTMRMEPVPAPGTPRVPAGTGASVQVAAAHGVDRPLRSADVVRSKAAPPSVPVARVPTRNHLGRFTATELSTDAVQVALDYKYVGDQGRDEVFVHAAALEGENPASRIPGTGFPGEPIAVGSGHVMIRIDRLPDAGPAASTHIRVCMVSLRTRSAFLCETFPFAKAWAPLSGAESGAL